MSFDLALFMSKKLSFGTTVVTFKEVKQMGGFFAQKSGVTHHHFKEADVYPHSIFISNGFYPGRNTSASKKRSGGLVGVRKGAMLL